MRIMRLTNSGGRSLNEAPLATKFKEANEPRTMSKQIDVDDDLYAFIASHTQDIGESASTILRRILGLPEYAAAEPVTEIVPEQLTTPAETTNSQRVFDVLNRADLMAQRSAVSRFLHILSMLYRCHPSDFEKVLEVRGRDRIYFSTSEAELIAAGNSTNPKQIPDSPYWVVTNNNSTRKKSMLTQVAQSLGYLDTEAEQIRDFL